MHEPALTEAVKTDLPSPKPNRRKRPYGRPLLGRFVLRFAALVLAVSALGAAYWFTRPPELVWWTSPELGKTGKHVRVLVPNAWELTSKITSNGFANYTLSPVDRSSKFIRRLISWRQEPFDPRVNIQFYAKTVHRSAELNAGIILGRTGTMKYAQRTVGSLHGGELAFVSYGRVNLPAFNRTYRQICNSLRIE